MNLTRCRSHKPLAKKWRTLTYALLIAVHGCAGGSGDPKANYLGKGRAVLRSHRKLCPFVKTERTERRGRVREKLLLDTLEQLFLRVL